MQRSCITCGVKDTCIKRTTAIFLLFIQAGRYAELTQETKEQFCVAEQCEHWLPEQSSHKEANAI